MKTKMLVIGLAVGLVLGVVGTAAATSSLPTYKACASSSHVLAVDVAGKCPAHTSKVSINAQGPRGATGKQGARGLTGHVGATGLGGTPAFYQGAIKVIDPCPYGVTCVGSTTASTALPTKVGVNALLYVVQITQSNAYGYAESLACSISAGINSNVNDGTIYWSGTPALNVQNSATPSTMVTFVNVGGSILNPILRCTDSNTQHTWEVDATVYYQVVGVTTPQ
jgi:hypothetical protein